MYTEIKNTLDRFNGHTIAIRSLQANPNWNSDGIDLMCSYISPII